MAKDAYINQIEAFIGTWGIKTSDFNSTAHLLDLASKLFGIRNTGVPGQMAEAISSLGKRERKKRVEENMVIVFGHPRKPRSDKDAKIMEYKKDREQFTPNQLQKMMNNSHPRLIDGATVDCEGELDIDPAKLLRKVVSAVISSGHADILWEYPEVLAFFGSRIPYPDEVAHLHNVDTRMFEAADRWPNRIKREN